ncbi:MAG: lytic transglycosylase domain-containing protein [Brevundimonas sp.]|uniref:lytic transglycosylase domain-containing protein n=1 Tax=Brevundimonas sp. TaxID=1871086 RepID=UPI00391CDFAA
MVSLDWAVAASLGLLVAASGQAVDWSRAGDDLFGAPTVVETADAEPVRLAPLSQPLMREIEAAAARHGLDEKLLHALVLIESGYRRDAVSSAGAGGLTQLMPATAGELGIEDRFDVEQNLAGGADYLARQLVRFQDLELALAAFNAGPARVAARGRVPDIPETRRYVRAVIDCYLALSAGRRVASARDCRPRGAG